MTDVSYVPGALTAVVGDRCWALVETSTDSPMAVWIWRQLGQGAPAQALLAGLLSVGAQGSGLPGIGFALLTEGPDGCPRLYCRGAVGATVTGGTVTERIDGAGLLTWREQVVQSDAERIVLGEPPAAGVFRLPAADGVLLAACVIVDLAQAASRDPVPYWEPSPPSPWRPVLAGTASGVAAAAPGGAQAGGAQAGGGPGPGVFPDTITVTGPGSAGPVQSLAGLLVPPAPAGTPAPAGAGADDEYDCFWGATQGRSVEDAAIRLDAHGDASVGRYGLPGAAGPVPRGPRVPGQLIDAVPWGPGLTPSAGEAGFTVKRADLAALAARSAPPDSIGPAVPALVCPAGHVNPPSEASCRRCGAPLPHDTMIVPRPVLGVLRLSVGDVIALDRGVVMGRSPRADFAGTDGEERPHVVKLPSADGDISRTHLRVTLDGWHVLVTDLNSTNGTLVTLPGRDAEQLRPGEPVPIKPGTVVTLADGIDFRYEVPE